MCVEPLSWLVASHIREIMKYKKKKNAEIIKNNFSFVKK